MPDQMSTTMRFKKWVHCDVPCKKEMHFPYICIFTRVHKLWFYSCVGVEKNLTWERIRAYIMTAKLTHGLLMLHMVHIWLRLAYKFARYAKYFYVNKIPLRRNGHQIRKNEARREYGRFIITQHRSSEKAVSCLGKPVVWFGYVSHIFLYCE